MPHTICRRNRLADAIDLIDNISKSTVNVKQAAKMSPEELKGKYVVGLLHQDQNRQEYCDGYDLVIERAQLAH